MPIRLYTMPIRIRQTRTVEIVGLPNDLTAAEARKICGVIMALAKPEKEPAAPVSLRRPDSAESAA